MDSRQGPESSPVRVWSMPVPQPAVHSDRSRSERVSSAWVPLEPASSGLPRERSGPESSVRSESDLRELVLPARARLMAGRWVPVRWDRSRPEPEPSARERRGPAPWRSALPSGPERTGSARATSLAHRSTRSTGQSKATRRRASATSSGDDSREVKAARFGKEMRRPNYQFFI